MEQIISKLVGDFEAGRVDRRQLIQSLAVVASAAVGGFVDGPSLHADSGLRVLSVDHISYRVSDYKRTRDFYADLLGLKVTDDTGQQCELRFGNSMITARNPRQANQPVPTVDHVCYWIAEWNTDRVKGELDRRGLMPRLDLGDAASGPNYVSFHFKDPDGYDVQISGVAQPGDSHYRNRTA